MAAVTADSVIVELEAKMEGYDAKIAASTSKFQSSMDAQAKAAAKAEASASAAAQRKAEAEERAQIRIAEAAEKSRIKLEEAAQRAQIATEAAAAKAAAASERAAAKAAADGVKSSKAAQAAAERKAAAEINASVKSQAAADRAAAAADRAAAKAVASAEAAARRKLSAAETSAQREAAAAESARLREERAGQKAASAFEAQKRREAAAADIAATRESYAAERAAGRVGNSTRNLGRQIADVGTQLASGQSPFLIIAQQAPQVADALADTGGRVARLAAFFAGPWGAALLAAGSILGIFVGKLLEGDDAAKKHKTSLEALTEALSDFQNANSKAASSESVMIRLTEIATRATYARAVAAREANKALLEQASLESRIARIGALVTSGTPAGAFAQIVARDEENEKTAIAAKLKKQDGEIARLRKAATAATGNRLLLDAAARADPDEASRQKRENVTFLLERKRQRREISDAQFVAAQAANEKRYQAETDKTKAKKGPKGPSAETLAARREAALREQLKQDEQVAKLGFEVVAAQLEYSGTLQQRAELAAQQIEFDRDSAIAAYRVDKDLSAAKRAVLTAEQDRLADQRLANNAERLRRDLVEEQHDLESAGNRNASELLLSSRDLARTNRERRRIGEQLLRLEYSQLEAEQQRILDTNVAGTPVYVKAQARLATLQGLRRGDEAKLDRDTASPGQAYLNDLNQGADQVAEAFETKAVDAVQKFNAALGDSVTQALELHGVFGDIIGDLVRMGIQSEITAPLAKALFGGGEVGVVGSIAGKLGSIFGRASGGYVPGGQLVRVNEGASPGRVEGFRPQGSGDVIPLGRMAARRASGGATKVYQIKVSADNAVTPAGFAQGLAQEILQRAAQMDASVAKGLSDSTPARLQSYQTLGL